MKIIWNGIKTENPLFVLLLGLCPALAVTTNFENSYLMGICALLVLIGSSFIVSLCRKFIPERVKMPVSIMVIATFVTILEILLERHVPKVYEVLGIYLPLIVVNCIVLGRALKVASKEKVKTSVLDAFGIGIGYLLALMALGLVREVIGHNTITLMDSISSLTEYRAVYQILPESDFFPLSFLISPAGAFLVLGLGLAIWNAIFRKEQQNESH